MTYTLMIIWYLASGQLVAEPWRPMVDEAACQAEADRVQESQPADRVLLLRGCLDAEQARTFSFFGTTLRKGEDGHTARPL